MLQSVGYFFSKAFKNKEKTAAQDGQESYTPPIYSAQKDLPRFLNEPAENKPPKKRWFFSKRNRGKSAQEATGYSTDQASFYPHEQTPYAFTQKSHGYNDHHHMSVNTPYEPPDHPDTKRHVSYNRGYAYNAKYDEIRQVRTWQARFIMFCFYWGTISAIWGVLTIIGMVALYSYLAPDPLQAGLSKKAANIIILSQNGKVIAEKGLRRNHIPIKDIPKHVVNAVLATEDRRFYYHFGFDPIGITRAIIANQRAGRIIQGGSTITQQLAKVLFLKPKRTYWRKVEEMLLALWLEYRLEKDQILELYLNRIYFGAGNYGIEAATQHYFGKTITDVTLHEAAILAGLIKSPSYYAPTRNYARSLLRAKVVLQNMKNTWFISGVEYQQALLNPPKLRSYLPSVSYGYVIDYVMELVADYGQDLQEDMIVQTTINYELQGAAQKIVKQNMDLHGNNYKADQAAAIIMDQYGQIKAMVGGRDYKENQFNRVVKSRRQPGSTFKPFVYLAAMEMGMTPDSQVYDGPIQIGNWAPKNYNDRYFGDVSLRQSLARSLNTVSVRLAEWVGRKRVIKTAHRLGINTDLKNNPSIALGTSEVSLMEITSAYAPFANGGYAVRPRVIKKINDQQGQVLYQDTSKHWGRVIRPHFVSAMNDMLTATIMVGTAQKASLNPHQAAGKTGTGQSYRDAWFIGYTAHYVTGVWIGNDDFKPMGRVTGGGLPTLIWKDLMTYAHANTQPIPLPGGRWEHAQNWERDVDVYREERTARSGSFFERLLGFSDQRRPIASRDDTTLGFPPTDDSFVGRLPGGSVGSTGSIEEDPFQAN